MYLFRRVVFYYHHNNRNSQSSFEQTESRASLPNVEESRTAKVSLPSSSSSSPQLPSPLSPHDHQQHQPIFLSDHQLAVLEQANEDAAHLLRQLFRSADESVFLELFEQEATIAAAAATQKNNQKVSESRVNQSPQRQQQQIWSHNLALSLEQLFMDSTLLLPPDEIPPSSFDSNFYLRLPMNEYERTRYVSLIKVLVM